MAVHPAEYNLDPTAVIGEWDNSETSLQCLAGLDKVYVQQVMDSLQTLSGIEMPNKYRILTEDDKQLFFLEEKLIGFHRRDRAFNIVATDAFGKNVFNITRDTKPLSYCAFCCAFIGSCKTEAKIKIAGKKKGYVRQDCSFNNAQFTIYSTDEREDDDKDTLYKLHGHSQWCFVNTEYDILNKDGKKKIGSMDKQGGPTSLGDNRYEVKFPDDATPQEKVILLGTLILIDYRFHYYVHPRPHLRRRGRR